MLTLDHLRLIQSEFSGESDAKKILDSGLFEGWQLDSIEKIETTIDEHTENRGSG